ncbi:maleylpyruvate isomerase family mycothiol-dependent enzyme [Ornithinimicrobium sp. Y1847]|uniref:maleylpyruvate isomerase family mycothiol-dependent enzyme n=1 Tax=Ornithinimicrobium sp. Y1847 TaxID=3405419 RepID=UPI003B6745AF
MNRATKHEDLWPLIHAARAELADDLRGLSEEEWRSPTLCGQWDVEHVVAHLTAAASVGRWAWIRSMVAARFDPAVHNARRLGEHLGQMPAQTLANFERVITSTVAPTGDLPAYLGEVLVHSQDIRRPLGLERSASVQDWTTVAEFYAAKDFAVNSRSLATGLRFTATDGRFAANSEGERGVSEGSGSAGASTPEVTGPTEAIVMVLAGRTAYLDALSGTGVAELRRRLESANAAQ